jgi:hypothetical protein
VSPCGDFAAIGSKNGSVIVLRLKNTDLELEEIYSGEHSSCVNI